MKTTELHSLAQRLHITIVGNGYIDWICPKENIAEFIDEAERLCIRITGLTWWCHVHDGHKPCGMGGPPDEYGDGWYSEMCFGDVHEFPDHDALKKYLFDDFPKSTVYRECLVPAFWIAME
ncbi:MAG: hypothetical protein IJZ95_08255 [Oscillospiraceae bacterium]|nr:hypothetical protein [Oscillospiraceae bacterium]